MARIPYYIRKQIPIPGLDNGLPVEKQLKNSGKSTLQEQLARLESRVLSLELGISLIRIQMEKIDNA